MTHRKLSLLAFILLCLFTSQAMALDIWQKYSKLHKLSADFSQTKELKSIGVTLKSSGSLNFERPNFFEWSVKSPKNFVFAFKDNTISLSEEGKVIKNADSAKLDKKMLAAISHLKAWMMIDQKFIEENYTIKEITKELYEFTPKSEVKMFKTIQIEMGKTYPIKRITLTEVSDDKITIEFSNTKMTYEN